MVLGKAWATRDAVNSGCVTRGTCLQNLKPVPSSHVSEGRPRTLLWRTRLCSAPSANIKALMTVQTIAVGEDRIRTES